MHNLDTFFGGTITMIGQSGAGKSIQEASIKSLADNKVNKIPIFTISTGALFRAAKSTSIASTMGKGAQIPSLEKIADETAKILENYQASCLRGEHPILVLDGIPRNGEDFTDKNERIPSQITQLAEMFARAGKRLIRNHPGLVQTAMSKHEVDLDMLRKFYYHSETDCGKVVEEGFLKEIAESFCKNSDFVIIDVTDETSEELMRLRSAKAIRKDLIPALEAKDKSANDERIPKVITHLKNLLKIQDGNFTSTSQEILLGEDGVHINPFLPFSNTDEFIRMIDGKMEEICRAGLSDLGMTSVGDTEDAVPKFFAEVKKQYDIPSEDMPRNDDMKAKTRFFRGSEYKEKVEGNLLRDALGVELIRHDLEKGKPVELKLDNARLNSQNVELVQNGPDRDIGLSELGKQTDEVAVHKFQRVISLGIESSSRQIER